MQPIADSPCPFSVAVVGAGCAGAMTAWRLASAGISTVLYEKERVPGAASACGGMMPARLAREMELPESLIEGHVDTICLENAGRRVRHDIGKDQLVSVERQALDRFLVERAARAGADLRTGCRVTGWSPDTNRITLRDGTQTQHFDLVVFADGPRSVARSAGLGPGPHPRTGVAFFRELQGSGLPTNEILFNFDRCRDDLGYCWVFARRDHVQVGMGRFVSGAREPLRTALDRYIASRPDLAVLPVIRSRGGIVPMQVASRFALGAGVIIGDAAGLVNPITGAGLLFAAHSAEMLASTAIEGLAAKRDGHWIAARYQKRARRSGDLLWIKAHGLMFEGSLFLARRGMDPGFRPLIGWLIELGARFRLRGS